MLSDFKEVCFLSRRSGEWNGSLFCDSEFQLFSILKFEGFYFNWIDLFIGKKKKRNIF